MLEEDLLPEFWWQVSDSFLFCDLHHVQTHRVADVSVLCFEIDGGTDSVSCYWTGSKEFTNIRIFVTVLFVTVLFLLVL